MLISFLVISILIALDQWFKVHIKTTMQLHSEVNVLGKWFRLHFTENPGMAFGLELNFLGGYGKLGLTIFRIVAVVFGFYILLNQAKKNAHVGFLICVSLILAGAIGNLIDSIFYGVIFNDINSYIGGYFHGHVVDMLYFPIIEKENFTFFSPVFNLADTFISTGAIAIFVFQRFLFAPSKESEGGVLEENIEAEIVEDIPKNEDNKDFSSPNEPQ